MYFKDRKEAGQRLAKRLERLRAEDVVVLGLPRGGVPVAREVAATLRAPLDVTVVRKLGVPGNPELAMGAVGEGGALVINPEVLRLAGVSSHELGAAEEREQTEVIDRVRRFRGDRAATPLSGRVAIVIDDGIATGATAKAACQVAKAQGARRVILAVPVAAPDAVRDLSAVADEVVALETPEWLRSIGEWYENFAQVSDDEVVSILDEAAAARTASRGTGSRQSSHDAEVNVESGEVTLPGRLTVPQDASGVVVFVHGSGSSRLSPRNGYVARVLNEAGLATLLFDLLTPAEERNRENVFDVPLLAERLVDAINWVRRQPHSSGLPVGLFGASTGAGAALWAAAEPGVDVTAIVSRGGRPDLAANRLGEVSAPTLLIVGELDSAVVRLNQAAQSFMRCENDLTLVPGATHLFEEPGTLTVVAEQARDWLLRHLAGRVPVGAGTKRA